jgi:hypothetical protein
MEDIIDSIVSSIKSGNWFAALFVAISLPDICGYLEDPAEKRIQVRYERWFERYLLPRYQRVLFGGIRHTFLSPSDCFALRCAILHSCDDTIAEQKARDILDRFCFVKPSINLVHCNQAGRTLQLQVDRFCIEIIEGVRQWFLDMQGNKDVEDRINSRMKIHSIYKIARAD